MTQEDKELLLKDLCARLPYGVKVNSIPIIGYSEGFIGEVVFCSIKREQIGLLTEYGELVVNLSCDIVKPYLRPMSSMTEEEEKELEKITSLFNFNRLENIIYVGNQDDGFCFLTEMEQIITFLNAHHFDYRGLIEKDLALEAPEGMYK